MRNRSRRSRRRRSNNSETRIRLIKIMVVLLVLFLPFQKETLYYLDYVWNLVKFRGQIPPNLIDPTPALGYFLNLFFGLVIYIISLYLFAFFNSQFLLPVYSRKQRFQVYEHFLQFVRGNYGPLIFVRDGQEISHFGEREKEGPGVVLINSNSAVVVGNRVHGPGIVFTGDKRIKSLFDLRKQIRSRRKVTAITRDGIEIETDIFVQFGISGTPHVIFVCENNNQIQVVEFNSAGNIASLSPNLLEDDEAREIRKTLPNLIRGNHQNLPILNLQDFFATRFISDRVQTVFNNQPRDPQTGKKIDWRDLPLAIAVEEFRNIIVRYPFDELFIRQDSQSRLRAGDLSQYPMNNIRREFSQLMRLSGMVAYVFVEAPGASPSRLGPIRAI